MRSLIVSLLATLSLVGPAPAISAPELPTVPPIVIHAALEVVCAARPSAPCATLKHEPVVLWGSILAAEGNLGEFSPRYPQYVILDVGFAKGLVNPYSVDLFAFSVLIHETSHWLDNQEFGLTLENVCGSEARAFQIQNTFLVGAGAGHLGQWDWRLSYPNCQ